MPQRKWLRGARSVSRRAVVWVVALGCAAGLAAGIWHRVDEAPRPEAPYGESASAPSASEPGERDLSEPVVDDVAESSAQQQPKLTDERPLEDRFPIPAETKELPTSKIADAQWEERRQFYWNYLRTFAAKADLTDSEWKRFLGDISDVSSSEITAHDTAMEELAGSTPKEVHASLEDASRLSDELAAELDERCATWMTEKQLKSYRFRLDGGAVLSLTRHLRESAKTFAILSDARR